VSILPSADAEDLRSPLRKFLDAHAGRDRLRAALETDTGYDPVLWRRAVDELGLTGLLVPERYGGSAVDLLTLGVVFEELGRALVCAPFLSTIGVATPALLQAAPDAPAAAALLAAIASGTVISLAWTGERPSGTDLEWDGARVNGVAPIVIDGADADQLLVAARTGGPGGPVVVLLQVSPHAAGVSRAPVTTLDTTRRLARVAFEDVPADVVAADAGAALDDALAIASLLLGAEQVGLAQRALDMAVETARRRVQFGRPIGSFQAVKHRCADMLVDIELSRSLVYGALHAVTADISAAQLEAALVRGFVSDACLSVAAANIQVHGGIGFTWEHDAHLYLKRAKAAQLLFGAPTAHRRRAATLLGVQP
jgi:alkylation response protein AidB-like acyl-CoA dehydrogenase